MPRNWTVCFVFVRYAYAVHLLWAFPQLGWLMFKECFFNDENIENLVKCEHRLERKKSRPQKLYMDSTLSCIGFVSRKQRAPFFDLACKNHQVLKKFVGVGRVGLYTVYTIYNK